MNPRTTHRPTQKPSPVQALLVGVATLATIAMTCPDASAQSTVQDTSVPPTDPWQTGRFAWTLGRPVLAPVDPPDDHRYSVKDPSIVYHDGRWHLFCTVRSEKRSHQIEYLSFADFSHADAAKRHVLNLTDGHYCAPQVFYFTPHKKWYLICQIIDQSRKPALQPAWCTNNRIDDPAGWSKPVLLYDRQPDNIRHWIDFWVICDATCAYLFFTSNDGRMWRAQTALADFPRGWSRPKLILRADIFEASHTYRLKGRGQYLTIVEAQAGGRRYYKAYLADTLDGEWKPLAATRDNPFAAPANVTQNPHWTDSFSHGELLRDGIDQTLTVDPHRLRFLFQGVRDADKAGKPYGQIPWRLGLIEQVSP